MSGDERYRGAVSSMLAGIGDVFRRRKPIGSLRNEDTLHGRTCLVTGASSGLGRAVAVELARRGGTVVIATGNDFPDALSATPVTRGEGPILLDTLTYAGFWKLAARSRSVTASTGGVSIATGVPRPVEVPT